MAEEVALPLCAAGALFVDDEGSVLLVDPTYGSRWEIPSAPVERGETPREACARMLEVEFELDPPLGRLLVVDWAPYVREERVRFVFDGGELSDEQLDAIVMRPEEICAWAYLPPDELHAMMAARMARRVTAAIAAREAGETWYLENGVPIPAP